MHFSLTAFGHPIEHYEPLVRHAESGGFEAFWLGDHVVTPIKVRSLYPYSPTGAAPYGPSTPVADVWVTVGFLAAHSTKIKLGPGVLVLPLRNPIIAARAALTAQNLSNGRILFGFGAGWLEEEFAVLGEVFSNRASRLDEMLIVMKQLWTGQPTSFSGRWFEFPEVQMSPAPLIPIPLISGGVSRAALERAALLADGWLGPTCSLAESIEYRDRLIDLLKRAGRDVPRFQFFARIGDPLVRDAVMRYQDAGFDHLVIGVPRGTNLGDKLAWIDAVAADGMNRDRQ